MIKLQTFHAFAALAAIFSASRAAAADFHPPAGNRSALVGASTTILPGGRFLEPYGVQIETGPRPFGIAVSASGTVATADIGYEHFGITTIERKSKGPGSHNSWRARHIWARTANSTAPEIADPEWMGVASGIAFDSEKSVWISEGDSGRVRQIDIATGDPRKIVSLNSADQNGKQSKKSFTGDLAFDGARHLLFVVDESNSRVALIDVRAGHVISSVQLQETPSAITLSPDGMTAWVTESRAVCAIDVRDPLKPEVAGRVPAPSPQAVLATADRVFVSNALDDSITVISAADRKAVAEIPLGIPSLEQFKGVIPAGLAYDPVTKWLLVAEAGLNAVGVVDTEKNQVIGHLPAGWMPTRVAISGDRVFVTNAGGKGTGPNPRLVILELGEPPVLHRGSVSTFIMPDTSEILHQTGTVFALNGLIPDMHDAPKPPAAIRRVVLIVKENRAFDEVLGDVAEAANGPVLSLAKMARFGMHGFADGGRKLFSVHDAAITPNQHEIARRWAFSDNFYVDGNTRSEGDIWLNGGYPDLVSHRHRVVTSLWDHLRAGGVTFQNFDEGSGIDISDQVRADRFIAEVDRRYVKGAEPFPQFVRIHLPNDKTGDAKPENGFPYTVSYVEDNDLATGRILDYLSHSPWWRDMVILVTETDTEMSIDHIDSHRTLLLAAGPYVKRNYVSHKNSSFPGLLRTVFELLRLPPLNLMDATSASLRDMLTADPDFTPYTALEPDTRIFNPDRVKTQ
jgi:DNA-binding beta-propeller fold protein YncE